MMHAKFEDRATMFGNHFTETTGLRNNLLLRHLKLQVDRML
jgi:hypothetical protein